MLALVVARCLSAGVARADQPSVTPSTAPAGTPIERARADFLEGTELARKQLWADALAAFERASSIAEHPVTTYNIGRCHLALGHATRARLAFRRAAEDNRTAHRGALDAALASTMDGLVTELDKLIVRLDVTIAPSAATVAVDGRPLAAVAIDDAKTVYLGDVLAPGPAEATPLTRFELWLDP